LANTRVWFVNRAAPFFVEWLAAILVPVLSNSLVITNELQKSAAVWGTNMDGGGGMSLCQVVDVVRCDDAFWVSGTYFMYPRGHGESKEDLLDSLKMKR
jgi:hypothetical protein